MLDREIAHVKRLADRQKADDQEPAGLPGGWNKGLHCRHLCSLKQRMSRKSGNRFFDKDKRALTPVFAGYGHSKEPRAILLAWRWRPHGLALGGGRPGWRHWRWPTCIRLRHGRGL